MAAEWSHELLEAVVSFARLETVFISFLYGKIENCPDDHNHIFPAFPLQGLRFLTHLHLEHFDWYWNDLTTVDLDGLFQDSSFRLEYIALCVKTFGEGAAEALATRHALVEAAFTYCESSDEALSLIARIPTLTALSVRGCDFVSFTFLAEIPDSSALKLFVAVADFDVVEPDEIFECIRNFDHRMPGCFVPCCFYSIPKFEKIESELEVCDTCKPRIKNISACCVLSCLQFCRVLN